VSAADEQEVIYQLPATGLRAALARIWAPGGVAAGYGDARAEALTACRGLGLLFGRPIDNQHQEIGDMVRTAYDGGYRACESRLDSPEMADAIAHALDLPSSVLERRAGESDHQLQVRAIQQVIAYGLAKR
jgi:hypothetical protein